jgi:hypothetical protein
MHCFYWFIAGAIFALLAAYLFIKYLVDDIGSEQIERLRRAQAARDAAGRPNEL